MQVVVVNKETVSSECVFTLHFPLHIAAEQQRAVSTAYFLTSLDTRYTKMRVKFSTAAVSASHLVRLSIVTRVVAGRRFYQTLQQNRRTRLVKCYYHLESLLNAKLKE